MHSLRPLKNNKAHQNTSKQSDTSPQLGMRRGGRPRLALGFKDSNIVTDTGSNCDILDCIDKEQSRDLVIDAEVPELQEEGTDSDSDSCCSLDSTASGPSTFREPREAPPLQLPPSLCSGCQKLFKEANNKCKTRRDPITETDPSHLLCDQWVLMKPWRSSRLSNTKGRLWTHLARIRKRHQDGEVRKLRGEDRKQLTCSQPHTFLQRNLRRCTRQAVSTGRRRVKRKRRRHSTGPPRSRGAKQHRLHSDPDPQNDSCPADLMQDDENDDLLVWDVVPKAVTMETPKPMVDEPKQKVQSKSLGFRDLLDQLRLNSSAIIRETHM